MNRILLFLLMLVLVVVAAALLISADRRPTDARRLCGALETGNTTFLQTYLRAGGDVNRVISFGARERGSGPLIDVAVANGHLDVVDFLLRNGADPNRRDSSGHTPLAWAMGAGSWDLPPEKREQIFKRLLEGGADPRLEVSTNSGRTPLQEAAFLGQAEIVRKLLTKGVDANRTNHEGLTALNFAANAEVARLLISGGAEAVRHVGGESPAESAVRFGHFGALAVLTNASVQTNAAGRRPVDLLRASLQEDFCDTLGSIDLPVGTLQLEGLSSAEEHPGQEAGNGACTMPVNAGSLDVLNGEEWQTHLYPKVGLKIDLPPWKAAIEDQDRMWSLMAFALVEHPASDVQYRVLISVTKLTEEQYSRFYRDPLHKMSDWANSEHLQTSQMTNAFWIYARKDVVGSNGFSYNLTGRIKRIPSGDPDLIQRAGGTEEKLAAEVQRILDSVEVLSTNSLSRLRPPSGQVSPAPNSGKSAVGDLGRLFNPMTPAESERVKAGFSHLRSGMAPEKCFQALGVDPRRQYPASSWGPSEKQSVSLLLGQGHVLLLVWDARSEPAKLLSAQLDDLKWPETRADQKP